MAATFAGFALFFSLAVYILVSVWGKRESLSVYAFFHYAGRPWMAIVSLTAYNVTLGTGVAYLLAQAKTTGWLVFLTPFGITAGYFAAAAYYGRLKFQVSEKRPNLYFLLGYETPDGQVRLGLFPRVFSLFIATTYFLLLAFELGVGGGFIGSTLFATPSIGINVSLAVIVFGVVIVYTAISGLRAAVNTDVAQFAFVIAFIIIVPYVIRKYGTAATVIIQSPEISRQAVLAAVLAILTAISTQFYSIVNPQMVTNYSPASQQGILRGAGILSGLIYLVIAGIGLGSPSQESLESSIRMFLYDPTNIAWQYGVVAFLLFAGMLAILLSTLDNLAIAVAQLYHDVGAATSRRQANPEANTSDNIRRLRVIYVVVALAVVPVTVFFSYEFQSIFYLLLTILFAAGVLSPAVFTALFLKATGRTTLLERSSVAAWLLAATAVGWVVYVFLSRQLPEAGTIFHLVAFGLAGTFAYWDYRLNRTTRADGTEQIASGVRPT